MSQLSRSEFEAIREPVEQAIKDIDFFLNGLREQKKVTTELVEVARQIIENDAKKPEAEKTATLSAEAEKAVDNAEKRKELESLWSKYHKAGYKSAKYEHQKNKLVKRLDEIKAIIEKDAKQKNKLAKCQAVIIAVEKKIENQKAERAKYWDQMGVLEVELGSEPMSDENLAALQFAYRGGWRESSRQAACWLRKAGKTVEALRMEGEIYRLLSERDDTIRQQAANQVKAILVAFREEQDFENGKKTPGKNDEPTNKYDELDKLTPARRQAYLSFLYAEAKAERRLEDHEAHTWLQENDIDSSGELDGYKPPPNFDTWRRYVSEARKASGEQKYTPRKVRNCGRSIVHPDEIEYQHNEDG